MSTRTHQIATTIPYFGHIFLQHPVVSAGLAAVYAHRELNPEWQFWKPRAATHLTLQNNQKAGLSGDAFTAGHFVSKDTF